MNKKFTRILSVILSVMMIFACAVTASADAGETAAEQISVSIRVEGLTKNLATTTVTVDKYSSLKGAIDKAGIDVVYEADNSTIKSVKGEAEVATSEWQYAVNGKIETQKISAYVLEEKSEVILYNATSDAVIPLVDATDAAAGGVVRFYSVDKDGKEKGISGATVKWQSSAGVLGLIGTEYAEYTTDSKGRILISDTTQLYEGTHAVEITKVNDNDVPEIVRMSNMTATVGKLADVDSSTKTVFEEIYDFLFSILKGVIEVWSFYINAIIGIFNGQPLFGAVEGLPLLDMLPIA